MPAFCLDAERVGFEPTVPVKGHTLSRRANSTTLAPFRVKEYKVNFHKEKVHRKRPTSELGFQRLTLSGEGSIAPKYELMRQGYLVVCTYD